MPTQTIPFNDPDGLKDALAYLIDEFAARIQTIRIAKKQITVDMDKIVELEGYGDDDLWEHLRARHVLVYDYYGPFSLAVIKDIYRLLKVEGLVPAYLLIHPLSTLKQTSEWMDMASTTLTGTTFLGLHVIENESMDSEDFVLAAAHSPDARVHNVILGVKGQIQR